MQGPAWESEGASAVRTSTWPCLQACPWLGTVPREKVHGSPSQNVSDTQQVPLDASLAITKLGWHGGLDAQGLQGFRHLPGISRPFTWDGVQTSRNGLCNVYERPQDPAAPAELGEHRSTCVPWGGDFSLTTPNGTGRIWPRWVKPPLCLVGVGVSGRLGELRGETLVSRRKCPLTVSGDPWGDTLAEDPTREVFWNLPP